MLRNSCRKTSCAISSAMARLDRKFPGDAEDDALILLDDRGEGVVVTALGTEEDVVGRSFGNRRH